MDHVDDQEVISAVLAGDANAYSVLVKRYQKPIFNLMYRMTGSYEDAADLAQETFIKAYEKLHCFRAGRRFFPWLYTIGLNHSRNFRRRSKMAQALPLDGLELGSGLDYPSQQEESMCSRLDSRRISEALCQLPIDYREAIILRYHQELEMEDVATALGLSLSGAKMRVHRGLKKLREILGNSHHENEENV